MPQDQTLDETGRSSIAPAARPPLFFIVLDADRPFDRGARHSLRGVHTVTIGRGDGREARRNGDGSVLEVRVPGGWSSSRHAVVRAIGGEWLVEDAGSRNGTFVNGQRITTAVLRDGDILQAGHVFFSVRGAPALAGNAREIEPVPLPLAPFGLRTLLPELEESYTSLARVARGSAVPILLLGPTGSGKEVLAREAHAQSRRPGPFVPMNCGALSPMLVESLLFGHVKGAFSGAARDELGFVRSANGGTLFLDEIGDLPAVSQASLLRVLQEREVVAVGATRATKVDVRIVAATHRPLDTLSANGEFRGDLLARLKGYTHRLLPLHQRMPDFGLLLADVLERVAGDRAKEVSLAPDAALALLSYAWPHNIRELYHAIASGLAVGGNDASDRHTIQVEDLPSELSASPGPRSGAPSDDAAAPEDRVLRDRLVLLLQEHHGNLTAVARAMGKGPTQIYRWIRRYQLPVDAYRRV